MSDFGKSGWVVVDKDFLPQGLDRDSGGYPFIARDVQRVHFWDSYDEAVKYAGHFKGFSVIPARITLEQRP